MANLFEKILRPLAPGLAARIGAYRSLIADRSSYLHTHGWIESRRQGRPCGADGSPRPWMNLTTIALLDERLKSDMRVFEYGSGHSTAFFARRVALVTAIEHDAAWHALVARDLPPNAELRLVPLDAGDAYAHSVRECSAPPDVIVVDGRNRLACLREALDAVSERGVCLLDDAERERYSGARDLARAAGFRDLTLTGLKLRGGQASSCAIYYRTGNCFEL